MCPQSKEVKCTSNMGGQVLRQKMPEVKPLKDLRKHFSLPISKCGKRRAGRLLAGREWNEVPEVKA